MLGLVIAGNLAMVFVFWELVGICSYLPDRLLHRAARAHRTAANKAFIVNRVGDFGMLIGLMALWGSLGTFTFGDVQGRRRAVSSRASSARSARRKPTSPLPCPTAWSALPRETRSTTIYRTAANQAAAEAEVAADAARWRELGYGHWLLLIAGVGIFCGCVGKSAQFPLHVWLPDAMEGPTPVSALIHSATMVAAGVYLVGRFYPVFTPEVMLVIAYIGCITLFIAATIAITATDIKRVLAYSTVSQLGYMMLALGVGGWVAGLFHLITHAFFKCLLFLCSGSVIHAVHTNDMPRWAACAKKMPWTAYTMLVGCLAIIGAGIPLVDRLQRLLLERCHPRPGLARSTPTTRSTAGSSMPWPPCGAAITAFYMFRLWYMTFAGEPRDQHVYDHAHESPSVMIVPLVDPGHLRRGGRLAASLREYPLERLAGAGPPGRHGDRRLWRLSMLASPCPPKPIARDRDSRAGRCRVHRRLDRFRSGDDLYAGACDPSEARAKFPHVYRFLRNKWYFDELYDFSSCGRCCGSRIGSRPWTSAASTG